MPSETSPKRAGSDASASFSVADRCASTACSTRAFGRVLGYGVGKQRRQAGRATVVPIDARFAGARTGMASDLARQLGCAFDAGLPGHTIRVDTWKQTSVAGVFAAGDASSLMTNATFASASGVAAAVGAHRLLIFGLHAQNGMQSGVTRDRKTRCIERMGPTGPAVAVAGRRRAAGFAARCAV